MKWPMGLPKPDFELPGVLLYCGDCLKVLHRMGKVSMVLTDPPYVIHNRGGQGIKGAAGFYNAGQLDDICDFDLKKYSGRFEMWSDQLVAFHSRSQIGEYAEMSLRLFGKHDLHVWYKTNSPPFTGNTWKSDLEYICIACKRTRHEYAKHDKKSKCYISSAIHGQSNLHPTQKPLGIMEKYIAVLTPPNQIVCDPFMGSGTTGVACMRLGRGFIGVEKERKYFDIAVKRIQEEYAKPKLDFDPGIPSKKSEGLLDKSNFKKKGKRVSR